jgi:hypothetical protein
VRQHGCNGASNQLWSIEALRQNDYELLYQADLNHVAWQTTSSAGFYTVEVRDGSSICRASGNQWIGVVRGGECAGLTYDGEPATTDQFNVLYQTR